MRRREVARLSGVSSSQREEYAYEDEQGEQRGARLARELLEVAVLTLLLFVAFQFVITAREVDGPSMQPTLHTPERLLVNEAIYYVGSPQRGDVIVFHAPPDPSVDYVKRVIGLPGDTVQVLADGTVIVDGDRINEPYIKDKDNPYQPSTWKLAPNQYFVLGDNRGDSSDSRDWGPVPRKNIVGKATLVYWPLSDAHVLTDWSGAFSSVRH